MSRVYILTRPGNNNKLFFKSLGNCGFDSWHRYYTQQPNHPPARREIYQAHHPRLPLQRPRVPSPGVSTSNRHLLSPAGDQVRVSFYFFCFICGKTTNFLSKYDIELSNSSSKEKNRVHCCDDVWILVCLQLLR